MGKWFNDVGQCGIGRNVANIAIPEQVKINDTTYLTNVVKISSGLSHCLALTKDGKVYAWGLNTSGQLGNNTTVNSKYAVEMLNEYGTEPVENIVDIAAGRAHSVVLNNKGTVYAVGYNAHGELGDATNTNKQILSKVQEMQI